MVRPKDTLIYCHDSSIAPYKDMLLATDNCTWSVSCGPIQFVSTERSKKSCKYICPVYSCPGSIETRAVGNGQIVFSNDGVPNDYRGRMNYYVRSIRGSRHSSGRCYDCQTLYRVLKQLSNELTQDVETHTSKRFSSQFLRSIGTAQTTSI